jgi:hypothetical protein
MTGNLPPRGGDVRQDGGGRDGRLRGNSPCSMKAVQMRQFKMPAAWFALYVPPSVLPDISIAGCENHSLSIT